MTDPPPRRVRDIDWSAWSAQIRAAEVLVIEGARILLIRKKRGLGAGKINGPGGRLEPGETLEACGIREVQEELCVTPHALVWAGENRIQFVDGLSIHLDVFRSGAISGTPEETEEAAPLWFDIDRIPYGEMWADTTVWIPRLLSGRRFSGRFVFEDDRMLDHVVEDCPRTAPLPRTA